MCEPFSAVNREKCRESVLAEEPSCRSSPRIQPLFAPFPIDRNRELSGNSFPCPATVFPSQAALLRSPKLRGVHLSIQRTWRLLRRMSLPLNESAPRAVPGHAGKVRAQGMTKADEVDRSQALGVCRWERRDDGDDPALRSRALRGTGARSYARRPLGHPHRLGGDERGRVVGYNDRGVAQRRRCPGGVSGTGVASPASSSKAV